MPKPLIAPSILSADFSRLGEEINAVMAAGASLIHFDVMDNHFVPNLTIGPCVLQSLRKAGIDTPIDVHLMIEPTDGLIAAFAKAGATSISFHPEASEHVGRSLQLIHDANCKAGLAINPETHLDVLDGLYEKLDFILMMSVNPGFGGQAFIPGTLDKIKSLKKRMKNANVDFPIAIDGGINAETIADAAKAGATIFVAGSAVFHSQDYEKTIAELKSKATLLPLS